MMRALLVCLTMAAPAVILSAESVKSQALVTNEIEAAPYPVIPLFAPPGMEPGREATSLVIGAIAANFWLDGDASLPDAATEYFASRTDPLLPHAGDGFPDLVDLLRGKQISIPLFARLVREPDEGTRLGFAWQDEGVAPPSAITFRTALDRHCFTLNLPLRWERLTYAPLELPEGTTLNERSELRLDILALPSAVYETPVSGDARQVFGVRCQSHTVVSAIAISGTISTVDGRLLATIGDEFL